MKIGIIGGGAAGLVTYDHARINLNYFQAQRNLAQLQGQDNRWLADLYMRDIDCHESAVISAVNVARQLAPASANLAKLTQGKG